LRTLNKRVIVSGEMMEFYEYEKPIMKDYKDDRKTGRKTQGATTEETKAENRLKTLRRDRTAVRRFINANISAWGEYPKFITLTFAENVTDLRSANYEWKKVRQRLEYEVGKKLEYLAVPEFQKRGAVHYHVILFNMPYVPHTLLVEIWGKGQIWINAIEHVTNVGAYVTSYMTKDADDSRYIGEKRYFRSRGLVKPLVIEDKKIIEPMLADMDSRAKVFEAEFVSEYTGKVQYSQFNYTEKYVGWKLEYLLERAEMAQGSRATVDDDENIA
jgi:hypothetical protein